MKRFIFSAIVLMAAATACTESGLIDTPSMYGSAIVFDTYIGKTPVTKAETVSVDSLALSMDEDGGAHLYAFMCEMENTNPANVDYSETFMDGNLICTNPTASVKSWSYMEFDEETNGWASQDVYWPGAVDLAFAAYNLAADACITNQTNTQFDFTVKDVVSEQVDLLVTPLTFISETSGDDTHVSLQFSHLLSRVGFKVVPTDLNTVNINIYSVKLSGAFPKTGTVDLTSAIAEGANVETPRIAPNTSGEYASEYVLFSVDDASQPPFSISANEFSKVDNAIVAKPVYDKRNDSNPNNRYMMIMPGDATSTTLEVVYNLSGETERHYARVALNSDTNTFTSFEAGKAYELVMRISNKAIDFSAEIVDGGWDTSSGNTSVPEE